MTTAATTEIATRQPARPPMTAEEATQFDRYSAQNAARLMAAASERGCQCQPYVDWFTYERWQAQGRQVQKGEKSTRLPGFAPVRTRDDQTGEVHVTGKRPWVLHLFCRCQTKEREE